MIDYSLLHSVVLLLVHYIWQYTVTWNTVMSVYTAVFVKLSKIIRPEPHEYYVSCCLGATVISVLQSSICVDRFFPHSAIHKYAGSLKYFGYWRKCRCLSIHVYKMYHSSSSSPSPSSSYSFNSYVMRNQIQWLYKKHTRKSLWSAMHITATHWYIGVEKMVFKFFGFFWFLKTQNLESSNFCF